MDKIAEYKYIDENDKLEKMKELMTAIKNIMSEHQYSLIDVEKLAKITTLSFGELQKYAKKLEEKEIVGKILKLNINQDNKDFVSIDSFVSENYIVNNKRFTEEDCKVVDEYMKEYNLPHRRSIITSVINRYLITGDIYHELDGYDQVQYQDDRIVFILHEKEKNEQKVK